MQQSQKELSLLKNLKNGDSATVAAWFQKFHRPLLLFVTKKVSNHADAEEIVQETFINCLRQISLFRGKSSLWTWMCAVARHEIADYYRKRYAKKALRAFPLYDLAETAEDWKSFAVAERKDIVFRVLARLSEAQSELLQLKYIDGKSVFEIAALVGKTAKAVESELFRARAAFRSEWVAVGVKQ